MKHKPLHKVLEDAERMYENGRKTVTNKDPYDWANKKAYMFGVLQATYQMMWDDLPKDKKQLGGNQTTKA